MADGSQAAFIKRERVRAFQQRSASWSFPFPMLLLQFPGLELRTIPAEIFRRHASQRRKGGDPESRKDLRRNPVKKPRPTPKCARIIIVQFDAIPKKLGLLDPHSFHDRAGHLIEPCPDGLIIIVTNSLRPPRNLADHVVRQI